MKKKQKGFASVIVFMLPVLFFIIGNVVDSQYWGRAKDDWLHNQVCYTGQCANTAKNNVCECCCNPRKSCALKTNERLTRQEKTL